MSISSDHYIVPQGATVLITGVNGFIASNIADQFLKFGFKVRGTTRSLEKNAWVKTLFEEKYGSGKFEMVAVPDMQCPDAFADAVKGVSAVVHTATIFSLDPNPHNVIPGTITGAINALTAAAKQPMVKRFVLTSSSLAALIPKPGVKVTVSEDTWSEEAVAVAYRDPPYEPERALPVYAASKTLCEKEAWKFMNEKKPHFTMNTVLPNMTFGASLDTANQGHPSTSSIVAALFKGDIHYLGGITPQHYIDVEDAALLHVAAVTHPDVQSERVFGFAGPVNGNAVLAIFRKIYPSRSFPADFQAEKDVSEILPRARAENLLRAMGKDGWTSLEESLRRNTEDLA